MSDEVDQANDHAMRSLDLCVAAARTAGAYLPPIGTCYQCNEPVQDGIRFCDVNCRNDYQARHPNA